MVFGFDLVTVFHHLHHHFHLIQCVHVFFIINDDHCAHDLHEDGTEHFFPRVKRPPSKKWGESPSIQCPFLLAVWRQGIHDFMPPRSVGIRTIQPPHIRDHFVKLQAILLIECRVLRCKWFRFRLDDLYNDTGTSSPSLSWGPSLSQLPSIYRICQRTKELVLHHTIKHIIVTLQEGNVLCHT